MITPFEALNVDPRLLMAIAGIMALQVVVLSAAYWKFFAKAGQPGWKALVPIYNIFVFLKLIRKPWWWFFLLIIPLVNIVFYIWGLNLLVRAFGKKEEYTVAAVFFAYIFLPFLAFDKEAAYVHAPAAKV
jgi:hypothetical protein